MTWIRNLLSAKPKEEERQNLGRNDLCWCGSGMKYKRCHLQKDAAKQREAGYAAQFTARNRMGDGVVPGAKSQRRRPNLPEENKTPGSR
jgi:hypothetical protein